MADFLARRTSTPTFWISPNIKRFHHMNESAYFNYHSPRAKQARTGALLNNKPLQTGLLIVSAALIIVGAFASLISQQPIGWFIISLAAPAFMLYRWGKQLHRLPAARNATTIDGLLASNVLGNLPKNPSPKDVADTIRKSRGSIFLSNRFMLEGSILSEHASTNPAETEQLWQKILQKHAEFNEQEISSATVAAALWESITDIDSYFAQLGITKADLHEGVAWYHHVKWLIHHKSPLNKAGGIGRDWAFGFTPLLNRFGHNISDQVSLSGGIINREVASHEKIISHALEILSNSGRRNVALVGQLGSGKSSLVEALALKLLEANPATPKNLHYFQVVSLDPSVLIAQSNERGKLESLVQQICYEALKAKNIILFMDDAHLFFEEGSGSVDISNTLMPILDGGALRIILSLDEQRWLQINQRNPSLAQFLNRIVVTPTDQQETMEIMHNQALLLEHRYKVMYTYQALQATWTFSNRYIAEKVMPGRAITLLESAAHNPEGPFVTKQSVAQAIEQTSGIKVATANTSDERETLLNLESKIHERMINQTAAVRAVSDALRRARAGVRNPSRPIGTFLFLGPTGVGKTELAKSIAAIYFGEESRLIRLDLNEYVRPDDVSRLIADPAQDSHSLTAQVSQQPFSVVLLDEIEKAHPEVLNTLLQVLDEGILRDMNNREISFRDTIIIATSNAGAEKIRAHIEAGENLEDFEQSFTDELISSNVFRPEFLNRYDDIVLFRSLKPEELLQVVDLIIAGINRTLSEQQLAVIVADEAKQLLVQAGNDPRLGARPMRRIVQRTVENIIADHVLRQTAAPGSTITVSLQDVQTMLNR